MVKVKNICAKTGSSSAENQQMINNLPNLTHPTLTPSIIFKGTKIDLNIQKLVPFGSYAATLCQTS